MEDKLYQRRILAQNGPDWGVFAFPDGSIQLDLGRAGLVLPELAFRRLCDFVLMACTIPIRGTIASTTAPYRALSVCPHTHVVTLGIEQTVLRFRSHEFVRLTQLCRQTLTVLRPTRLTGMSPHTSYN